MESPAAQQHDTRLQQLRQWLTQQLDQPFELQSSSSDASFRRYFRLAGPSPALIAMDAPPEQEPVHMFVDVAHRLQLAGVHVPEILAQDLERGFLLLRDVGQQTYLEYLQAQPQPWQSLADPLFRQAIDSLLIMQQYTSTAGLPVYNRELLQRELNLFQEWYLQRHLQLSAEHPLLPLWQALCEEILDQVLQQPRVFVHRDFMPRNLMISEPTPAVIDFQDAVLGPISYDPVCLCRDAFVSWPEQQVQDWLHYYWQHALQRALPVAADFNDFLYQCDVMAAHRHLKVIGIFARIRYRDNKPAYFEDVGRFFDYLQQTAQCQPQWRTLTDFLQALSAIAAAEVAQ